MGKYFGTDGIRGKAEDFNEEFVSKIINATIDVMKKKKDTDQLLFLIGGDTRKSTEDIIKMCLGICKYRNVKCLNVGVLPTPAISYIAKLMGCDIGICVTASHNPSSDNGIKIFNHLGEKSEEELEELIENNMEHNSYQIVPVCSDNIYEEAKESYIKYLIAYIDNNLEGLNIGLDCANGATAKIAEEVFTALGANVTVINNDNSYGHSINENCGSTHINTIKELVVKERLDFGASFDGDGDRCLFVDHEGNVIDGDMIIAIVAKELKNNNKLNNNTLVTTIVANPGLKKFAKENNIDVIVTDVGDSNVYAAMKENNLSIGGEQAGHIILPNQSTGDGILTALYISLIVKKNKQTLKELASVMIKYPEIIKSIPADKEDKKIFKEDSSFKELISKYQLLLDEINGTMNIRPSGTQDLIRFSMWGNLDDITVLSDQLSNELINLFKIKRLKNDKQ